MSRGKNDAPSHWRFSRRAKFPAHFERINSRVRLENRGFCEMRYPIVEAGLNPGIISQNFHPLSKNLIQYSWNPISLRSLRSIEMMNRELSHRILWFKVQTESWNRWQYNIFLSTDYPCNAIRHFHHFSAKIDCKNDWTRRIIVFDGTDFANCTLEEEG